VNFAAITLSVASQLVFVVVYFVIDSVRQLWIHSRSVVFEDLDLKHHRRESFKTRFKKISFRGAFHVNITYVVHTNEVIHDVDHHNYQ
jgi:hypothetical protein